jgi:hypothetical protein
VTAERVRAVAARILAPEHRCLVVVGDAARVADGLRAFGNVERP